MTKPNHLATEISLYLQQHATNPVDWYPWGFEALNKARKENKPILLSIGYSACHWCHVMAHESFEDQDTANLMNELYVNIKVDREERPDLDKIYQTANFFLTQRTGGWPLTVFLTPDDLTPFFSGTYFPREAKYQLPAFKDILTTLATIYKNNLPDIKKQNAELMNVLIASAEIPTSNQLNEEPLKLALQTLEKQFDHINGGFGHAPKFPQPTRLTFLMSEHSSLVIQTLKAMASGGIYDQLLGGFFRYSVDAEWRIPHFEKMLYDNGQLLMLYALAAKQSNDSFLKHTAHQTAKWVMYSMQSADGGYYSSVDADSEGHEGIFYCWDKKQIQSLLTAPEFQVIELYFGLNLPANFEGKWHLYLTHDIESIAAQLKIELVEVNKLATSAIQKLLSAREQRIHPGCDQKVLTAWNALMIKGMAIAADVLQAPEYLSSTLRALAYLRKNVWKNNRLLASCKDGQAHLPAYLDDYAYLLDALLTLLQISWRSDYLQFATELADILLLHFSDNANGGFFFTADNSETIVYRPKTMMDEAIPSGNGIAAQSLQRLGHLLGETRYLEAAERTLLASFSLLGQFPAEHCSLLLGLKYFLTPSPSIVLRGSIEAMRPWQDFCKDLDYFAYDVYAIPSTEKGLPGLIAAKEAKSDVCAYVCKGMECLGVIEDFERFKEVVLSL
ncbi:MAG: thioredoxin domain-containing protein [Gammaproteobacteria bacterium]